MEIIRTILGYIVIYISIVFGSIFVSNKFNKKIESCIVIDILFKMILMYIFGLCNLLYIGSIITITISIILGIITLIKQRKNTEFKEKILTNGFYFFTIIYFCFMIFTYGKTSYLWDEYSHWSLASKEMFYTNKLLPESQILIVNYPPFPTILQYLFNKTIGIYSQGTEIFANYILGFSLLLPLFEIVNSKSKIQNICISITILCIPAIFHSIIFYEGIYTDSILALLIGYIFYQIYNQKDAKFLKLSILLAFVTMSLTKATGLYIALILIGSYILLAIIEIITKKYNVKKYILENKRKLISIVLLIIILLLTSFSWKIYSKEMQTAITDFEEYRKEVSKEESIGIIEATGSILTTLLGSTEKSADYDQSNRLLFKELTTQYSLKAPIRITIMYVIIFMAIASIVIYKFINKEEKSKYKNTIIAITIGLIIYIAFLQLAYLTKFGSGERLIHASLDRYINTYLLGFFILLVSIIITKISNSNKNKNQIFTIFIMCILLITQIQQITDATIASGTYNAQMRYDLKDMNKMSEFLNESLQDGEKVYVVNQNPSYSLKETYIKYILAPKFKTQVNPRFGKELAEKLDGDILEVWSKILTEKYDYIYIYKNDEYFEEMAKDLFEEEIKENIIYKIQKEENNIKFIKYKEKTLD